MIRSTEYRRSHRRQPGGIVAYWHLAPVVVMLGGLALIWPPSGPGAKETTVLGLTLVLPAGMPGSASQTTYESVAESVADVATADVATVEVPGEVLAVDVPPGSEDFEPRDPVVVAAYDGDWGLAANSSAAAPDVAWLQDESYDATALADDNWGEAYADGPSVEMAQSDLTPPSSTSAPDASARYAPYVPPPPSVAYQPWPPIISNPPAQNVAPLQPFGYGGNVNGNAPANAGHSATASEPNVVGVQPTAAVFAQAPQAQPTAVRAASAEKKDDRSGSDPHVSASSTSRTVISAPQVLSSGSTR